MLSDHYHIPELIESVKSAKATHDIHVRRHDTDSIADVDGELWRLGLDKPRTDYAVADHVNHLRNAADRLKRDGLLDLACWATKDQLDEEYSRIADELDSARSRRSSRRSRRSMRDSDGRLTDRTSLLTSDVDGFTDGDMRHDVEVLGKGLESMLNQSLGAIRTSFRRTVEDEPLVRSRAFDVDDDDDYYYSTDDDDDDDDVREKTTTTVTITTPPDHASAPAVTPTPVAVPVAAPVTTPVTTTVATPVTSIPASTPVLTPMTTAATTPVAAATSYFPSSVAYSTPAPSTYNRYPVATSPTAHPTTYTTVTSSA